MRELALALAYQLTTMIVFSLQFSSLQMLMGKEMDNIRPDSKGRE